MLNHTTAILSSEGKYTSFSYGDLTIRFMTSPRLNKYLNVKEWNNGYLVVTEEMQKIGVIEDYIDLRPILKNLNIDQDMFLSNIKKVEIKYAKYPRNS